MTSVEQRLAEGLARGEELMVATVIRTGGEPPSRAGAKLLVARHGPLAGTLGCSEFDAAVLDDASTALDQGTPRLRTYTHELGTVEVHLEPYAARPTLVVGGATPVAAAVLEWSSAVGFRTVLVETRADRLRGSLWDAEAVVDDLDALDAALPARAAQGGGPPQIAASPTSAERRRENELYAVLTDHDSPDVVGLCARLLPRRPRYLGLMGSRRHTSHHLQELRSGGVAEEDIARIRTPAGLDLGGRTAPEIALAIVAGLVSVRRGGRAGWKDGTGGG